MRYCQTFSKSQSPLPTAMHCGAVAAKPWAPQSRFPWVLERLLPFPLGPDIICRWWTSAVTLAISWLQGDDAAVHSCFTDVERVPKALEVTECVNLLFLSRGLVWVSEREQVCWGAGMSSAIAGREEGTKERCVSVCSSAVVKVVSTAAGPSSPQPARAIGCWDEWSLAAAALCLPHSVLVPFSHPSPRWPWQPFCTVQGLWHKA